MSPSVEPFDEAKYKALMDGLECKEVQLSELLFENNEFRIDSEFVKKEYITFDKTISGMEFCKLGDFSFITDGIHLSIEFDETSGINLISAKAPKQNIFDISATGYISQRQNNDNPKTQLKENDIILSTVGTIGNCAVVDKSILPANADRHVGIIRINNSSSYLPQYVSTFLLCKYGAFQTLRHSTGNVQLNLFIYKIKELKIPYISNSFQIAIANSVKNALTLQTHAFNLYKETENHLEEILGMDKLLNYTQNNSIKSLSNSFAVSGRLDAEYYQPKYEQYAKALKTNETVSTLCNIFDKNYLPEDIESYQYIELANVGASGEISGVETQVGKELPTRARRKVKSGQVIVSSIEGSLKSCALITDEYDGALCSTGFYVVDSDYINSETLLVLFQSKPIQALLKQRCSGTILTGISKDEFLSMPLPKVGEDIQKEIAAKVQESFALRKQSKQLLEFAKQAVEMAIEEGEDRALEWLKSKGVEG